jgi:hypothetical protein
LVKKLLPVPFSPVSTVRGRTFTVPPLNLPKLIENFNKFIGYLDKLEKKQKFKSVHRYVDFLRSCLTPLILNLTEGEEMYVLLSVNIKQIFINNTKNGIQRFGKKTLTCAIFTRQYS